MPTAAVAGPVLVIERSADGRLVVAVAVLFAGFGSVVVAETVAVFETEVPELNSSTTVRVAELPELTDQIGRVSGRELVVLYD